MSGAWYAIVEGEIGDHLWPTGFHLIDTYDNEAEASAEARRLSALGLKHYRVLKILEHAIYCAPHMKVIAGEGQNPMTYQQRQEARAGIKEYLAQEREKAKS
jgi:hypothetical protein